jgi:hypothetical protein
MEDENEDSNHSPELKQLKLSSGHVPPDDMTPDLPKEMSRQEKRMSGSRGITSASQDTLDSELSADLVFARDPSLHGHDSDTGNERELEYSRSTNSHGRAGNVTDNTKSRKRSLSVTRALGVFHENGSSEGPGRGPSAPRMNTFRSASYSSGPAETSTGERQFDEMSRTSTRETVDTGGRGESTLPSTCRVPLFHTGLSQIIVKWIRYHEETTTTRVDSHFQLSQRRATILTFG